VLPREDSQPILDQIRPVGKRYFNTLLIQALRNAPQRSRI